MILKFALSILLMMVGSGWAMAQCGCNQCIGSGNVTAGSSSSQCGGTDDWEHPFFDCCRRTVFDHNVCDPCCTKVPYVSLFGGWSQIDDFHRTLVIDPAIDQTEEQGAQTEDGFGVGGAIGYRVHRYLRVETEFVYREVIADSWFINEFSGDVLTSSNVVPATGILQSYSGMFNLVADLSPRRVRCFNLYGGGGIGMVWVDGGVTTPTNFYDVQDSAFAWQFIGGVNFPVTKRLEAYTEYKYLGAHKIAVDDVTAAQSLGDFKFDTHSVFFGVRINPW